MLGKLFTRRPRCQGKSSSRSFFRPQLEQLESREVLTLLPAGFTETTVIGGLNGPTNMEFAPDGRLFVLEQTGSVKLVRSDGTTFTALHINVDASGERGMLGIAFDPNFAANHFVYLYFTNPNAVRTASGVHNQISRFTVDDTNPQQPVFVNSTPVLDLNDLSSAGNHNGGSIHFGKDNMLYVAVGDNANAANSQTLNNLLGKFLRLDVSGWSGTPNSTTLGDLIPADNPFVNTATGINRLIWALGLRNPYTFAVQPGTGTIHINDVGQNAFEEINLGVAGANYGWPRSEGFKDAGDPATTIGTYRDPVLAYGRSGGPSGGGNAIVGGVFYNPATVQFPSQYVGKYFYEDLGSRWIRVFDPANPGSLANPDTSSSFADETAGNPVSLTIDAVGNLYYLSLSNGQVKKISYAAPIITNQPSDVTANEGESATFMVAANGAAPLTYQWQHLVSGTWTNVGPNASSFTINPVSSADTGSYRVTVSNTFGSETSTIANLTVNAANTPPAIDSQPTDQDANVGSSATFEVVTSGSIPLTYQWQHLVDGTWTNVGLNASSFTINPVATGDAGSYRVMVTNSFGSATSNVVNLAVNQLPTASISAPLAGAHYNWGDTIAFAASASDPEDGPLPASGYSWEVRFFHQTDAQGNGLHSHPFQTFTGVSSGSFVADFAETSPHVWYRITLTVTDSKGATSTVSTDVLPNTAQLTLATLPAGLRVTLDGQPVTGPTSILGVIGQPRSVGVVSPQVLGGKAYQFISWSDGGASTHAITTPAAATTFTANFGLAPLRLRAINAGGVGLGGYRRDIFFRGGTKQATDQVIDTSAVANPLPQAIYQTSRGGNFVYVIPGLPRNRAHLVRLDFSENFATAVGQRIFNVTINGQTVLENFDIFAAAGGNFKAIKQEFIATADRRGRFVLGFSPVTGSALVNAITIQTLAPPILAPAVAGDGQVNLVWVATAEATGYRVHFGRLPYRNLGGSPLEVGNVTSAIVSGLTNGKRYYFWVQAILGNVFSRASNFRSALPTAGV
jgi:glucose/arabinose dehydrogenase